MKILRHTRSIIKAGYDPYSGRYRRIYSADEVDQADDVDDEEVADTDSGDNDDGLFGDVTDIQLTGDVEEDFDNLVDTLRSNTQYEDMVEELEDVVNDPKLYALLADGFGNGELANVKMSASPTAIYVGQLLPCQSEIGLDNSLSYPLKQDCSKLFDGTVTIVAPIVTYRKTYVIDGHHRWSQLFMLNPKAKISAINFNYESESPFTALRNFQGAIAVANKEIPKSYSKVNNVYAMSEDEIFAYVDKNIQDACWESLVDVGVCDDRDGAVDYIVDNVMLFKKEHKPFADAPAREFMPQTNEKSIKIAEEGQTNI